MRSISIVIPAYNEEQRVGVTIEAVHGYLDRDGWGPFEILVVDDGSKDGTRALVESLVPRFNGLRLLRNPRNEGKGYSVRHGMQYAQHDWVLFTDADLSAPIEELGVLMNAANEKGAAVAIGSRALNRKLIAVHQSVFREFAGRFFNLIMRVLIGLPFWDTQCGFKLFRRDAAREVFSRQRLNGFGFDVEALFLARKRGFKTVEIPVRWSHVEGTKVRMLRDSVNMFWDLVRVRWNQIRGRYR